MDDEEAGEERARMAAAMMAGGVLGAEDLLADPLEAIGRYEVKGFLGEGGAGRVYKAWDPQLGREVAIKLLEAQSAESLERFKREMRVLADLRHPNVVEVYDAGTHEGQPFFVMEYMQAETLAGSTLPRREAVRVMQQVALACQAAHSRNVIHHDLKPANILLGDRPVVADFGIAKVLDRPTQTQTGKIIGTPGYMAPEQIAGRRADPRSDVFAMGVMLYEQLAGRSPFPGSSPLAILARRAREPVTPLREVDPSIPAELAAIVERAMAEAPEERQQSALRLAAELSGWLAGGEGGAKGAPSRGLVWIAAASLLVLVAALIALGTRELAPLSLREPAPLSLGEEGAPRAPATPAERLAGIAAAVAGWEREASPAAGPLTMSPLEGAAAELRTILEMGEDEDAALAQRARLLLAHTLELRGAGGERDEVLARAALADVAQGEVELARLRPRWRRFLFRALVRDDRRQREAILAALRRALGLPFASPDVRREAELWLGALEEPGAIARLEDAPLLRAELLLLAGEAEAAAGFLKGLSRRGSAVAAARARALVGFARGEPLKVALRGGLAFTLRALRLNPRALLNYELFTLLCRASLNQPRALLEALPPAEALRMLRPGRALYPKEGLVLLAVGLGGVFEGYHATEAERDPAPLLASAEEALLAATRLEGADGMGWLVTSLAYAVRARYATQQGEDEEAERLLLEAGTCVERVERAQRGDLGKRVRKMVAVLGGGR